MYNAFKIDVGDCNDVILETNKKFKLDEVSKISNQIKVIYEKNRDDFIGYDIKFVAKRAYFKKHCCKKMIVLNLYSSKKTCATHKNWHKNSIKFYMCSCNECNFHYKSVYDYACY